MFHRAILLSVKGPDQKREVPPLGQSVLRVCSSDGVAAGATAGLSVAVACAPGREHLVGRRAAG